MRAIVTGLMVLALAACDSGEVPSPAERMNNPNAAVDADIDPSRVTLRTEGLSAGSESFYFAAGQNEVQTALAAALGGEGEVVSNDECGAGPMTFVDYPGGLSVNFQDGSLVGWSLSDAADNITTDAGFTIGTDRSQVEAMGGFSMIEGSTLGDEFVLGEELAGFFEGGKVSMLYAGTQCFFR